jgi:hypothetical protein
MTTLSVVEELRRHAAELARKAQELEERACARAMAVERASSLGAGIRSRLADAQARRSEMWEGLG